MEFAEIAFPEIEIFEVHLLTWAGIGLLISGKHKIPRYLYKSHK